VAFKVLKKDVVWGFVVQLFSIFSGIIIIPLMLRLLTAEEIGFYYLMLTAGTLVSLFDFGFAPQFGRNVSYVFNGAQEIRKEGVQIIKSQSEVNFRLLSNMIQTARLFYRFLAFFVLLLMLSFGTYYMYQVTDGFVKVENTLIIWIIFSFATFFTLNFAYYTALLTGQGLIMESKKTILYGKLIYIFLAFVFLFLDFGLLGVTLASFMMPFMQRLIAHAYFFKKELSERLDSFQISFQEKFDLFKILGYNASKLGLVLIGAFAVTRFSLFLAGLYLTLPETAAYGLMVQLFSIINTLSSTLFGIYQPRLAALRVEDNKWEMLKDFAFSMLIFYLFFWLGAFTLVTSGTWLLSVIGSNALLPSTYVLAIYGLVVFLEGNHANFATFIITNNDIPFVPSSLVAGSVIVLGSFMILKWTTLGLIGLVLVQGITQLAYANWKWPYEVCKSFNINILQFLVIGFRESKRKISLGLASSLDEQQ
jgi:O-antigen/teichoic acid export membrane protein